VSSSVVHPSSSVSEPARAKSGENWPREVDVQFGGIHIRASFAVQFTRAPAFRAGVERVVAVANTGGDWKAESRKVAEQLVPFEGAALDFVDGYVSRIASRLKSRLRRSERLSSECVDRQRERANELREIAAADPEIAAEVHEFADEIQADADELQKRPDKCRERGVEIIWTLAKMDLLQRPEQMVWSVGSPPLTQRKNVPREADYDAVLDILERVLSGTCAVAGCPEPARIERYANYNDRRGVTAQRRVRPGCKPICCAKHGDAKDGKVETEARELLGQHLKRCQSAL
jgi:hypothetical protein